MNTLITLEKEAMEEYAEKLLHGWILYADGDSSLNPHYIDLYRNACRKHGMSIQLGRCNPALLHADASENRTGEIKELSVSGRPGFVINRTRDYRLAELLESQGIRTFNHSQIARLGNDKSEAYRYMQQRIPIMPTLYSTQTPPPWYPAVIKSCGGHGGTEVFYIRNESAWKEWKQNESEHRNPCCRKQYVMQQAASDTGKDVRVYIVGNRIAAAVLRTSKTDFRSNYCLGGSVELYELSEKERALVQSAVAGLSIGMAGIDFIFHKGEMVFNEIEDMAGARGLYSLTDYDIVDEYISYIWEELQHVRNSTEKTAHL